MAPGGAYFVDTASSLAENECLFHGGVLFGMWYFGCFEPLEVEPSFADPSLSAWVQM